MIGQRLSGDSMPFWTQVEGECTEASEVFDIVQLL